MKMHLVCGGIVGSLLGLLLALPVAAQYKIVDADGSITYTDRPSPTAGAKITPLRRNSLPIEAPGAALPLVLRQAASRYPVMLYSAADCTACDSGRLLLQQRGVPQCSVRAGCASPWRLPAPPRRFHSPPAARSPRAVPLT